VRTWICTAVLHVSLFGMARATPCLPSDTEPVLLELRGDALRLCGWNGLALTCATVDLRSGVWATAPAPADGPRPKVVPPRRAPRVEIAGDKIAVCAGDGGRCKTLAPKRAPDPGIGLDAAVNFSNTLAALSYFADKPWVETFDPVSGRRLGRFAVGSKRALCTSVDVLGESILVTESECGGPTTKAWLATRKGRKIADAAGLAHVAAGGSTFAFVSPAGDKVVLQDVTSGKRIKQIAIGGPSDDAAELLTDFRRLVVVWGGKRAGDVVTFDFATEKVTTWIGRRCP
jgi:hypothetical protein